MADIKITDLTEGKINGEGVFDQLQQAFDAHIQREYQSQRLRGVQYAEVYLGGIQAAMQQAVVFLLGKQAADAEAEKLKAEKDLIEAKTANEIALGDKIQAEIDLLNYEHDLIEARIWTERAKTSNTPSSGTAPTTINGVMGKQVDKYTAEIDLLDQKTTTEAGQTDDNAGGGSPMTGILGKQSTLLQRQADGFLRDAEYKVAKLISDSHAVHYTTLDGDGVTIPGLLNPIVEGSSYLDFVKNNIYNAT